MSLINDYCSYQLAGGYHTPTTSVETIRFLTQVEAWLDRPLQTATPTEMRHFKDHLSQSQKPATVKSNMGRASGFFTWCIERGYAESNPTKGLKFPRTLPTRRERYCTKVEREKLLLDIERDDIAFILWTGFFLGLRIKEIIESRRSWLDMNAGVFNVQNTDTFTTKDKACRQIAVSDRLSDFLAIYLAKWEGDDSTFLLRPDKKSGKKVADPTKKPNRWRYDPTRPFKAHVGNRGLPWVSFHVLRHTFATLHAIAGTPLTTIARELGDDPLTTYKSYIGYSRDRRHANASD